MAKTKIDKETSLKREISVWKDRIERGKKLREKKIKKARKLIDYYKSKQWQDVTGNYQDKPVVNLIFSHIKSQIPFLYFQNPKWYAKPKPGHYKYAPQAKTATIFLNYYASENLGVSLKKQMRAAILDAFFIFGVIKSGYVVDMQVNKNYGKPKIKGYDEKKEPIYEANEKGDYILDNEESIVTNEKFASKRTSPACLIFDTEADSFFEEGRYIIEEISLPLEEVKSNSKYKKSVRDKLVASYEAKAGLTFARDGKDTDMDLVVADLKRITIYEIWDIESNSLKVLASNYNDDYLQNIETPAGVEKHPYSFLYFNDIPDEIYPLSDLDVLKPIQDEHNKGLSLIQTHAKKYGRKYGYIESMIDEDEIEKAESGEDSAFFKVKELPLGKCIEPLEGAPQDPAVLNYYNETKMAFDKLAATSEADRGAVERRKTAYEASKLYGSSDLRKEDRRSLVEDWAADVGAKLLQSMQANLTAEDAQEISPEQANNWVNITDRNQIAGQFNVSTIVGSMTPKLPEYERNDFVAFMQSLTQFPPELIQVKVNFDAILSAASEMFPALEDIQLLNPPEKQKEIQAGIDQQKKIEQLMALSQQMSKSGTQGGKPPVKKGNKNAAV